MRVIGVMPGIIHGKGASAGGKGQAGLITA